MKVREVPGILLPETVKNCCRKNQRRKHTSLSRSIQIICWRSKCIVYFMNCFLQPLWIIHLTANTVYVSCIGSDESVKVWARGWASCTLIRLIRGINCLPGRGVTPGVSNRVCEYLWGCAHVCCYVLVARLLGWGGCVDSVPFVCVCVCLKPIRILLQLNCNICLLIHSHF